MFRRNPCPGIAARAAIQTLAALLLVTPLLGQSVFTQIPAFTSECYGDRDGYAAELEQLRTLLRAEVSAAEEANRELRNAIDHQQQQQRLIAAVQSNPDRAVELMRMAQSLAQREAEFRKRAEEREDAFAAEGSTLMEEYRGKLAARMAMLEVRMSEAEGPVVDQPGSYRDQVRELNRRWDAEYAIHCGEWFGTRGLFGAFLERYQLYLTEEWLPEAKSLFDLRSETVALFGGPDVSELAFTGEHQAAIRYIDAALEVLTWREARPRRWSNM